MASNLDIVSESDTEFWVDLDSNPSIRLTNLSNRCDLTHGSSFRINLDEETAEIIDKAPIEYYKERFLILIERVRTAANESYQNMMEQIVRNLHKEYQSKIQDLIKTQQEELINLKVEFDRLNVNLISKDLELERLSGYIIDQEILITDKRQSKTSQLAITPEKNLRAATLEKDLKASNLKIYALKEICKSCNEQTDKAKADLKIAEDIVKMKAQDHVQEIILISKQHEDEVNQLLEKIEKIKQKYNDFKKDVHKELEIRMIINRKQNDVIASLQNELKNVKIVLSSPRIHTKLLNKSMHESSDFSKKIENETRFIRKFPLKSSRVLRHSDFSIADYGGSTQASPSFSKASDIDLSGIVSLLPESPIRRF